MSTWWGDPRKPIVQLLFQGTLDGVSKSSFKSGPKRTCKNGSQRIIQPRQSGTVGSKRNSTGCSTGTVGDTQRGIAVVNAQQNISVDACKLKMGTTGVTKGRKSDTIGPTTDIDGDSDIVGDDVKIRLLSHDGADVVRG